MSTRIEKDFVFGLGLHYEGSFYVNNYDINLSIIVETNSYPDQNLAIERITYFIENILQHAILVEMTDTDSMEKYKLADMKICEMPIEPHDQTFGMVLINKLNAIMENKMYVTDMVLGSTMSNGVRYHIAAETAENLLVGNHWWNRSSLELTNNNTTDKKIVSLFVKSEWDDLELNWEQSV